jgi:hypothetical protein
LYPLLVRLVAPLVGLTHTASLTALTELVWALLVAQSLHPAALVRALPTLATSQARQGVRRGRRLLERDYLQSHFLTPAVVRAALRLVDAAEGLLVLDRSRCVRWAVLTVGGQFHGGRGLPVAWAVLPYPCPRSSLPPPPWPGWSAS